MRKPAIVVVVLISALMGGCGGTTDEASRLAAPANLSATYLQDPTFWHYTFTFTAVPSAVSYLIYYSPSADNSTAISLASGTAPPVVWAYSKANVYNNQNVYFWVRAYDGKHYGEWSAPAAGLLN